MPLCVHIAIDQQTFVNRTVGSDETIVNSSTSSGNGSAGQRVLDIAIQEYNKHTYPCGIPYNNSNAPACSSYVNAVLKQLLGYWPTNSANENYNSLKNDSHFQMFTYKDRWDDKDIQVGDILVFKNPNGGSGHNMIVYSIIDKNNNKYKQLNAGSGSYSGGDSNKKGKLKAYVCIQNSYITPSYEKGVWFNNTYIFRFKG